MSINNQAQPKASLAVDAKARAAEDPVTLMSANDGIEVGDGGNGTVNDSSGKDTRPPFTDDFDSLSYLV